MPFTLSHVRTRLDGLQKRLRTLDELTPMHDEEPEPSLIISDSERTALIRFFREVVRGGIDEQLWRAKNPKEHALLIRTCGAAPAGRGEPASKR